MELQKIRKKMFLSGNIIMTLSRLIDTSDGLLSPYRSSVAWCRGIFLGVSRYRKIGVCCAYTERTATCAAVVPQHIVHCNKNRTRMTIATGYYTGSKCTVGRSISIKSYTRMYNNNIESLSKMGKQQQQTTTTCQLWRACATLL